MYCSLAVTVSSAVLSLVFFRLSFEGCRHSLSTALSRRVFEGLAALHGRKTLPCLLTGFSLLGKAVATMFFARGLPPSFYMHCYPFMGQMLAGVQGSEGPYGVLGVLRNGFLGFVNLFAALLKRPMNEFHVLGFFGVMLSVRLLFLALTVLFLCVVVKYTMNLLGFKGFLPLLAMVLLPSFALANLFNFLVYRDPFTFWYFGGLAMVLASMYCSFLRRSLKSKH